MGMTLRIQPRRKVLGVRVHNTFSRSTQFQHQLFSNVRNCVLQQQQRYLYYFKNYKCNSLVIVDELLMIIVVHFEGVYATWKSQVRYVDQPITINIENNKIIVFLEVT